MQNICKGLKTIFVCSQMIASRFSLYDYEKNPNALKGGSFDCNVYKKFDKCRIILKNYLNKNVSIALSGSSYRCMQAYTSFEMIPLLILENAVKYSRPSGEVQVNFSCDVDDLLIVSIDSYSPYCSEDDLKHIFDKGFRGKNAIKTSDGSGIGLYFVKLVCNLHDIEISAHSDSTKITQINNIAYAPFKIQLQFPKSCNDLHI